MVPSTTSVPRRGERAGESGLRWGSFALRVRRDACPMLLHRAAQRSYPQDKCASMKWVIIIEIWYDIRIQTQTLSARHAIEVIP